MSAQIFTDRDFCVLLIVQEINSILIEPNDIKDHPPMPQPEEIPSLSEKTLRLATPLELAVISRDGESHSGPYSLHADLFEEIEEVRVGGGVHDDESSVDGDRQAPFLEHLRIRVAA
jgi:hypothetical protein